VEPARPDGPLVTHGTDTYTSPVKSTYHPPTAGNSWFSSHVFGTACGVVSSVAYTTANIFLRGLVHVDPYWVSCVKAAPTAVLASLLLAHRISRGLAWYPGHRITAAIVATGLLAQWGGNVAFQWSLGVVGLALAVPLTLGTLIASGALLGRIWLGEPVTPRSAVAMTLLVVSIAVLSLGAGTAHQGMTMSPAESNVARWILALGVFAACASGVAYSILGVVIRRVVTRTAPLSFTLLAISVSGVVMLGAASFLRLGSEGIAATTSHDLVRMLGAGVSNAVAFFALSRALQIASVIEVNAINASQTALAAGAGVLWFAEPTTWSLFIGTGLTILGVLLIDRRSPDRRLLDQLAAETPEEDGGRRGEPADVTGQ